MKLLYNLESELTFELSWYNVLIRSRSPKVGMLALLLDIVPRVEFLLWKAAVLIGDQIDKPRLRLNIDTGTLYWMDSEQSRILEKKTNLSMNSQNVSLTTFVSKIVRTE